MDFSIEQHVKFFDGYFDAVGRLYTTNTILIAPAVRILENGDSIESLLSATIEKAENIEDVAIDFEKEIAKFLKADARERILFYLTDYLDWFNKFSESFKCIKYKLAGKEIPNKYLAYVLTCNDNIKVLVYLYEKSKTA